MNKVLMNKIEEAEQFKFISYDKALSLLEEAHLVAQPTAIPHTWVHIKMFQLAWLHGNWRELLGQLARILLAAPGSWLGRAPKGNVGSTKMGIFETRD